MFKPRSIASLALLALLALGLDASPAAAQTQVKPYMMLIFDNSGSMGGSPLTQAKNAVRNVVSSAGDLIFGLTRFARTCTCSSCSGSSNCYGDILSPLLDDNQNSLLLWVNTTCSGGDTGVDPELIAYGYTPIAETLTTVRTYYGSGGTWLSRTYTSPIIDDPYRGCRPYHVILLTDGLQEGCSGNPVTAATNLRSTQLTVTGGTCTTVANCCPTGTCRTSGPGTPSCVSGRCHYDVHTWAIGFRITAPNTQIENIATAGGTDCPGSYRGCYAADEAALSAALSDIVSSSVLIEVCNGVDDDCDGLIDEGFTKYCNRPAGITGLTLCTDPGETRCDGIDDNCNGLTDEGLVNLCGTCGPAPVEICDLIDNDCDTLIDEGGVCAPGCIPTAEICNNRDDDCDGLTDEGVTRPCGTDIGECVSGTQTCTAGIWGACAGSVGPIAELCNNRDDDCDGRTDGFTRPCGSSVGVCTPGTQICTSGSWSTDCVGAYSGGTEVCNLLDDDCDGSTDEGDPGGGGECGGSVGECLPGTRHCVGGALVCVGGRDPVPEVCDLRDNDCDGSTDEGNPGGGAACYTGPAGTDGVGICEGGVLRCLAGALVCDGQVLPTVEDCNNLDDDCDTETDEGLTSGATCGTDEGECEAGTNRCVSGAWVCDGEVGPGTEVCDLLDNDCDGATDEGNPGGGVPCGWDPADPSVWDLGICEPGISNCVAGAIACEGMIGPVPEECNALDDDCNGLTDDLEDSGTPCGSDEGECQAGTLQCLDGRVQCVGGRGPTPELCDCLDNDCDGETDEGAECGGGASCIDCTCVVPCDPGIEMSCPSGRVCECGVDPENPTTCFCMPETEECGDDVCNACENCVDGECVEIDCGPCQTCQVATGRCVDACAGVSCDPGLVCICGTCEIPDCYTAGYECPAGRQCEDGVCVDDPCYDVSCPAPQFCRDGTCHDPCEQDDICPAGQLCYDGECVDDPCYGVTCDPGEECAGGTCTTACADVECAWPLECDPATGECEEPPCWDLRCPDGYDCVNGTCYEQWHPADDADAGDGGVPEAGTGQQVLATGAGGCACRTTTPGGAGGGLLALLGLVGLGLRRRARKGA